MEEQQRVSPTGAIISCVRFGLTLVAVVARYEHHGRVGLTAPLVTGEPPPSQMCSSSGLHLARAGGSRREPAVGWMVLER